MNVTRCYLIVLVPQPRVDSLMDRCGCLQLANKNTLAYDVVEGRISDIGKIWIANDSEVKSIIENS